MGEVQNLHSESSPESTSLLSGLVRNERARRNFWVVVVFQIALLEALLPTIVFVGSELVTKIASLDDTPSLSEPLLTLLVAAVFLGYMCFLITAVIALLIALAVCFVAGILGFELQSPGAGVVFGGLIGLVITLGFAPWVGELVSSSLWIMTAATVLGQLGGFLGARKALAQRKALYGIEPLMRGPMRISIRQILCLITLAAVILALLKLAGMLTPTFLIYLGVWIALQVGAASAYFLSRLLATARASRST